MSGIWISLLPFAVFFAWLFLFGMGRQRPCPECGKLLARFTSPWTKTRRQWLYGGYQCRHCGCEADARGQKVAKQVG